MARPSSYAEAVAEAYDAVTRRVSEALSLDEYRFEVSLFFDEVHVRLVDEPIGSLDDRIVAVPGLIGAIRDVFARHGVTCDGFKGWYDSPRPPGDSDTIGWVACPGCPACGLEPEDRVIIVASRR